MTQLKDSMSADAPSASSSDRAGSRSLANSLEVAGISLRPGEFVVLVLVATTVGALAGLTLVGPLGLLATIVVAPLVARAVVNLLADRRRAQVRRAAARQPPAPHQQPEVGPQPAPGARQRRPGGAGAGAEPSSAGCCWRSASAAIQSDALNAVADRMASKDFDWVVGAIDINREVGGDLAAPSTTSPRPSASGSAWLGRSRR